MSQLFDIRSVPGKGRGLIAHDDIVKGTRILCEKPLFTAPILNSIEAMDESIAARLKALSEIEQQQFLSLHNNFPGEHSLSGIFKTNCWPCGPDTVICGVYPTICLINHNCFPNSNITWNSETESVTIHAIRKICAGEEITISYNNDDTSDIRRAKLKNAFGFDCDCSVCSLPPSELQASDSRRNQMKELNNAIAVPFRIENEPGDCLADCHKIFQLLNDEFKGSPGPPLANLYHNAFQICIVHGDEARASVFADRAYEETVICEGEDGTGAKDMKSFMENPTGHENFRYSTKWKTSKGEMPKGLDTADFEKWLWRQGE